MICPNCGAATAFEPVKCEGKGQLLEHSGPKITAWGAVSIDAVTPYHGVQDGYAILICRACGKYFIGKNSKNAAWSAVYPIPQRPAATEIPEPIKSEFQEAQLCFAVWAFTGCLLVCRTALIALQRQQKVTSLKELRDNGIISQHLYGQSNEVRLWANIVGHEDLLENIEREDCEELLLYLEALLDAVYVQPKRLAELAEKRKQLQAEK